MTMPYVYDKPEADKLAGAKAAGQASFDAIREMVEALQVAAKARDDAEDSPEGDTDGQAYRAWEYVERTIHEDALTVEVRSGWYSPGARDADTKPAEYRILLSTGGPAVQIVGSLSEHGEPETAVMQVQDWFLPWTDYHPNNVLHSEYMEILLAYARCFYFGE